MKQNLILRDVGTHRQAAQYSVTTSSKPMYFMAFHSYPIKTSTYLSETTSLSVDFNNLLNNKQDEQEKIKGNAPL
jgi:hypothetical protein